MIQLLMRIIMLSFVTLTFSAQAEVQGEILEFGYYAAKGKMERQRNYSTATGYVRSGGDVTLVEKTSEIPVEIGRLFGFKYRISGFPKDQVSVDLKLVVSHPEIERPNGTKISGYSYPVTMDVVGGAVNSQSGYKFDKEYEMVAGEWRFQYFLKGEVILDQTFNVVERVADNPELMSTESSTATAVVNNPSNPPINPVGLDAASESEQSKPTTAPAEESIAEEKQSSIDLTPINSQNSTTSSNKESTIEESNTAVTQ